MSNEPSECHGVAVNHIAGVDKQQAVSLWNVFYKYLEKVQLISLG